MNYRHIFHAGNPADLAKHAVLTLILAHLRAKPAAFAVIDTHAGIGAYPLDDPRAQKTGEAVAGIQTLLAAPPIPALADYYRILDTLNPDRAPGNPLRLYPGSPLLAFHMLRPQDRLVACEWHPEDAATLRRAMPHDPRIHLHHRDGYEALRAFVPPAEKRGLVLIDPPYDQPDEYDRLAREVHAAWRRWPTGIFMIWYPVKDRPAIWRFHDALATAGIANILCAEFIWAEEVRTDRLNGSGLVIINPPWQLDKALTALFPALHAALGNAHRGSIVRMLG